MYMPRNILRFEKLILFYLLSVSRVLVIGLKIILKYILGYKYELASVGHPLPYGKPDISTQK